MGCVSCQGFRAEGNEFSYYMLLTSSFMLNHMVEVRKADLSVTILTACQSDVAQHVRYMLFVTIPNAMQASQWTIFPWVQACNNNKSDADQLRAVCWARESSDDIRHNYNSNSTNDTPNNDEDNEKQTMLIM
eukprot:scaffold241049_cov41-Prasinocladus_malaysianus.AAC.1